METVRKTGKSGVENAVEILSISDKSAALKFLCCFILKEGIFQNKDPHQVFIIVIIRFTPRRFTTLRKL